MAMTAVFDPGLPEHVVAELERAPGLLIPAGADPADPAHLPRGERYKRGGAVLGAMALVLAGIAALLPTAPELVALVALSWAVAVAVYGGFRGVPRMLFGALLLVPVLVRLFLDAGPAGVAVVCALTVVVIGGQHAHRRFAGADQDRAPVRFHGRYLLATDLAPADRETVRRAQRAERGLAAAAAALRGTAFDADRARALLRDRTWRMACSLYHNRRPGVRPLRVVTEEARRWAGEMEELAEAARAAAADTRARDAHLARALHVQHRLTRPYRY
ncbi:hypothetical protein ACFQXA_18345 [Nocardiopsis composta]